VVLDVVDEIVGRPRDALRLEQNGYPAVAQIGDGVARPEKR
jgi:hypothetical protein